jgi:hypothetical protein
LPQYLNLAENPFGCIAVATVRNPLGSDLRGASVPTFLFAALVRGDVLDTA